jgi:hypothetical protein
MFRKPALLKKITPAVACGETGLHSSAPTSTSLPRGSRITAWRQRSKSRAKRSRRSAMLPFRVRKPSTIRRVGSPPV